MAEELLTKMNDDIRLKVYEELLEYWNQQADILEKQYSDHHDHLVDAGLLSLNFSIAALETVITNLKLGNSNRELDGKR